MKATATLRAFAGALALSAGCAWASEPGVSAAEIVIGQVAPLTGVLAGPNREAVEGALACFAGLNARGGVHGRKIVLKQFDDAQNADKSLEITRNLIRGRSVFGFFMHRTSPTLEKVVPEATKAGYPVIAPQVGPNVVYEPVNALVFNVRARYSTEIRKIVEHSTTVGLKRIGILHAQDAFGRDNRVAAVEALAKLGMKPVAEVGFDNRTVDVGPAVEVFSRKTPADVVIMIASAPAAAEFVKRMRARGASPTFVSLSNTSGDGYIKALGREGDGVLVTQVMPYPFASTSAIARDYRNAMKAHSGAAPSYASMQGYISARLLVEGLRRAGPRPTQKGFVQALEALGDIDLGGYQLTYGPGMREGSTYVDITIVRNGRFLQ